MLTQLTFPIKPSNTLVFLNGQRTSLNLPQLPRWQDYKQIAIADGAWNDIAQTPIKHRKGVVVMGDGDSIEDKPQHFVYATDQNFTDGEKVIRYLSALGISSADVIWGSGGEMDHFLGNLSVAQKYHQRMPLRFLDAHQCYFFADENSNDTIHIEHFKHHLLSIYPFPKASLCCLQGALKYPIDRLSFTQNTQQSLRNQIISESLTLKVTGQCFVFVGLAVYR